MPAQRGEIRPCGLTSVISVITSPAQPSDILPRCIRCQSLAEPLSELYWHIGDTTTRLGSVSPRRVIGEKRTLTIDHYLGVSFLNSELMAPQILREFGWGHDNGSAGRPQRSFPMIFLRCVAHPVVKAGDVEVA